MKKRTLLFAIASIVLSLQIVPAKAQLRFVETLRADDQTRVDIFRDEFGVPHITAETEKGAYFGQGYCAAQDRLFQMLQFMHFAEGRLAEIGGSGQISTDAQQRAWFATRAQREQVYAQLEPKIKDALDAYAAGVNTYVRILISEFQNQKLDRIPRQIAGLVQSGYQIQLWTPLNSLAVAQFMMWQFGQIGGNELGNLNLLRTQGENALNQAIPLNDTSAFTTIPNEDAGLQRPTQGNRKNIGMQGNSGLGIYKNIPINTSVLNDITNRMNNVQKSAESYGIPKKFGSFCVLATGAKTQSGGAMILGAPQMDPADIRNVCTVNEVELSCPSFNVGGASIAGIPFVILGRTSSFGWSLTTGYSDNTDIFIDTIRTSNTGLEYYSREQWRPMTIRLDTINVLGGSPYISASYHNEHGFSIGVDTVNKYIYMMQNTFRKEETGTDWDMLSALYSMNSAKDATEFENAVKKIAVSFNVFYAGNTGDIRYYHVGKYVDMENDPSDPRLPRFGNGSQEWVDFLPFTKLPKLTKNPTQGYLVNWNNKPVRWWNNGDVAWRKTDGITKDAMVMDSVVRSIDAMTFDTLKSIPYSTSRRFPQLRPYAHADRGTYQFALEFLPLGIVKNDNILRPGQSGFVSIDGVNDKHFNDMWSIFNSWNFKKQRFNEFGIVSVARYDQENSSVRVFPQPLTTSTRIDITSERNEGEYTIVIADISGRVVATLRARLTNGHASVNWDGRSDNGVLLSNGVYTFRATMESTQEFGKILLQR